MAKKRKKSYHRRRRVSGVGKTDLQAIGLGIAGAVISNKITAMMKKSTNTMIVNIAPYTSLAAGLVLPMLGKQPALRQLAQGMVIGGGLETLKQLAPNLISGPYQVPVISGNRRRLNGGVMTPGMVAGNGGYSPARSSVHKDALSVISGIGVGAL